MPKISVQFHALPEEIIDYVKVWSKEFGLFIVIIELNPSFTVNLITDEEYKNNELCNARRICLYLKNPDLNQRSYSEFLNKNPDCLSVAIGKYSENKLEESIIGTQTQNTESLKIWKKIVKKFNANTLSGAWVINPYNKAKAFYKEHRYTESAKKLFKEGVNIVPVDGWNKYFLCHELENEE